MLGVVVRLMLDVVLQGWNIGRAHTERSVSILPGEVESVLA